MPSTSGTLTTALHGVHSDLLARGGGGHSVFHHSGYHHSGYHSGYHHHGSSSGGLSGAWWVIVVLGVVIGLGVFFWRRVRS
ncbi:hypothetical protein ACFV3R_07470 [Streptomyces sp. NPDC059740]|uniref:hypothetical protein n=1 Tax=Streptomyces sp. NPDC059740 TaxID=3346926 RepID=UPI0036567FD7